MEKKNRRDNQAHTLTMSAFNYKYLTIVIYLWSTLTKKEFLKCISLMLASKINYSSLEFKDSFRMCAPGLYTKT